MNNKKNFFIYIVSVSYLLVYSGILFLSYDSLSDIVPTHINYNGQVDGYNYKIHLWYAILVNFILLLLYLFLLKNPEKCNYPIKITDENREKMYYKMKLFVSYLSVITSVLFSFMIFNALKYEYKNIIVIITFIVIIPILIVNFINLKYFK